MIFELFPKILDGLNRLIKNLYDSPYPCLAGARVYFNDFRTGLPATVYADHEKTTPCTRPLILDVHGQCHCFIYTDETYMVTIEDVNGKPLMQLDQVEGWRLACPRVKQNTLGFGNFKAYK